MVQQIAQEGGQCHDKTWATLAQSKMGWYCLIVLEIGGYKAHYCYNTIILNETKLYGTINSFFLIRNTLVQL